MLSSSPFMAEKQDFRASSDILAHVNQTTPVWRFCALRSSLAAATQSWEASMGMQCSSACSCTCAEADLHTRTPNPNETPGGLSFIFLFLFKSQDRACSLSYSDTNFSWCYHEPPIFTNWRVSLWFKKQIWMGGLRPKLLSLSVWVLNCTDTCKLNLISNSGEGKLSIFQKVMPHTSEQQMALQYEGQSLVSVNWLLWNEILTLYC